MEQYEKGFQRFHAGEDGRPVTALASFYLFHTTTHRAFDHHMCQGKGA